MYLQIRAWVLGVIALLFLICIVGLGYLYINNDTLEKDLSFEKKKAAEAEQQVQAYKQNTEPAVKGEASQFLKAFLEKGPKDNETVEQKIKPYTTQKARQQVIIPGQGAGEPTVKIGSKLADMKLYYTPVSSDKASILAKVTREISVEDEKPSSTNQMIELQLNLLNGSWIVDDIQLISQ